jgi:Fe-S cluster assembly protein SufD
MSRDVRRGMAATATAGGGVLSRLAPADALGPQWLAPYRRAALAWVASHGFPTRRHEDWRYTALDPILGAAFEAAPGESALRVDATTVASRSANLGGPRLVFGNGHFRADLSDVGGLPAGATVIDLASALRDERELLEPIFRGADDQRHAFAAVNSALATDGVLVHLAEGVRLPAPIHLVFVTDTAGERLLASPRSVFLLDPASSAQIVETHIGTDGDVHCTNTVTDVRLGRDASLEHYKIQDEPHTAYHLALLNVRQDSGSRFTSHSAMLGAAIARQEVRVLLAGEGADLHLDGLYLPVGTQTHDNTIFVDHASPGCASHQLYKGALSGRSRGIFNGHIMVRPGADGTDAHQTNKNLLLADRAEADTRPRLEIYADDVKCTHGAAVGQLDEQALLYLRSRGIDEQAARRVLVDAFIQEMIDRVSILPVRERLTTLLAARTLA